MADKYDVIVLGSGPGGYVAAIRQAAEALVADGLMLREDVSRAVADAGEWGRPRHLVRL